MFQPIKKTTITEKVIEKIAEFITSGKLLPGEKLPNERDLAEQFGVARGRIREALRALATVGMVTIKPGEGSFVTGKNQVMPTDTILYLFHSERGRIEDVYAARKLIEGEVFYSAANHLTEEDFQILGERIEYLRIIPEDDHEEFQRTINEIDLHIGEKCGNQVYFKLLQTMVALRHETSLEMLDIPGARKNSLRCREDLLEAFISGNWKKINVAIAQIYESAKQFYQ